MACKCPALLKVLRSLMTDGVSETSCSAAQVGGLGQGLLGEVKQAAGSSVGEAMVLRKQTFSNR